MKILIISKNMDSLSNEFIGQLYRFISDYGHKKGARNVKSSPEYLKLKLEMMKKILKIHVPVNEISIVEKNLEYLGYEVRRENNDLDFYRIPLDSHVIYFQFGVDTERVLIFGSDSRLISDDDEFSLGGKIKHESQYVQEVIKRTNEKFDPIFKPSDNKNIIRVGILIEKIQTIKI